MRIKKTEPRIQRKDWVTGHITYKEIYCKYTSSQYVKDRFQVQRLFNHL